MKGGKNLATKKKNNKNSSNKTKKLEKDIQNMENNLARLQKISKEQEKEKKQEEKRKKQLEEKIETIRNDLKTQLLNQNKLGKQFDDMIEDYIYFVKLKEELQKDINLKGIRYESMTGNGYVIEKDNKSPEILLKVNSQMLKILQDLDLKTPDAGPEAGEGDDLL